MPAWAGRTPARSAESVAELARLREQPLEPGVRAFVCFSSAWAAYAQGRGDDVAPHVLAMLDALEQAADPQVWDRCFFVSILTGLPGLRPLLERFADGAMRLTGDQPTQLRAGVMHIRTWLAFSQGRVDEAAQWLARADEDCRWLGRPRSLMTENWMAHTLIDAVRGDRTASYAAAQENKRDLEESAFRSNRLTHEYEELFTFIRAAWILGDETMLRTLAPPAGTHRQPARMGRRRRRPCVHPGDAGAAGRSARRRADAAAAAGRGHRALLLLPGRAGAADAGRRATAQRPGR